MDGGQPDGTVLLALLACAFVFSALAFPVMMLWYINRVSPEAISRRLLRGCPAISRRTKWLTRAWDPSQPRGPGMWTQDGPAVATYTLTPDRLIRLELVRKDGRREEHIGPPLTRLSSSAWDGLIWLPPTTYLFAGGIGAAVGYGAAGGSRQERWQGATIGLMLAFAAAYIVLIAVGHLLRVRARRTTIRFDPPAPTKP